MITFLVLPLLISAAIISRIKLEASFSTLLESGMKLATNPERNRNILTDPGEKLNQHRLNNSFNG